MSPPAPILPFSHRSGAMAPARFTGPRAAVLPASALSIVSAPTIGKKPRKPKAPKEKPPGMTAAAWIAEEARKKHENLQRQTREKTQQARQQAALAEA